MNDIVVAVLIPFGEVLENLHFDERLLMETLLVSDDFERHFLIGFMVERSYYLTEAPFSYHFESFVAIRYVVVKNLRKCEPIVRLMNIKYLTLIYSIIASVGMYACQQL